MSADLNKGDQSDRKTDTMGEWDKTYEDSYFQGKFNTGKKNEPMLNPWHSLPHAWDSMGPVNQPIHLQKGDYKTPVLKQASATGTYLVYFTVDTEEHATRFTKDLFKRGLVAAVEQQDGGFDRSYLKFGRISTEKGRSRLQMTTSGSKVLELIEYCNNENPTNYDYPVPNSHALPISMGNELYLNWVTKQTSSAAGKINYSTLGGEGTSSM